MQTLCFHWNYFMLVNISNMNYNQSRQMMVPHLGEYQGPYNPSQLTTF